MKFILSLLVCLFSSSCCNSYKQAIRYLKAQPYSEIVTVYDTLYTDNIRVDTLLRLDTVTNTSVIEKERLRIEIKKVPDTRYIQIRGECKPDTVIVEKEVIKVDEEKPKKELTWREHAGQVSLGVVALCVFGLIFYLVIRVVKLFI